MRAALLLLALIAVAACKPEKNPPTGATSGPSVTAATQAEACDKLLKNDRGEYSAGKCVCEQTSAGLWRCTLGN